MRTPEGCLDRELDVISELTLLKLEAPQCITDSLDLTCVHPPTKSNLLPGSFI